MQKLRVAFFEQARRLAAALLHGREVFRSYMDGPKDSVWPRWNRAFTLVLLLYLAGSLYFFLSPLPDRSQSDIYLLSRNQEVVFEYSDPDKGVQTSPGPLPGTLIPLLLLSEDQGFFEHPGVDPAAILRATYQNVRQRRIVSGASTIAQQYVRIQYADSLPSRAWFRKSVEALYALKAVAQLGKRELLQRFLEKAPLGRNRKGFYSGAHHYFGKDLWLLNCDEQAVLVVLLRRTSMDARALRIRLSQLFQRVVSERPELAASCGWDLPGAKWHGDPLPPTYRFYEQPSPDLQQGSETADQKSSDSNIVPISANEEDTDAATQQAGYPHSAPHLGVFLFHNRGIRGPVYTELDQGLQTHIQSIMKSELAVLEDKGANQAAVIVLERDSALDPAAGMDRDSASGSAHSPSARDVWKLRAMIGSTDFSGVDGQNNGALAIHDAGSVLKPFLYALAIEDLNMRPGTLLDDSELVVMDPIHHETYSPRNHDLKYSGIITFREALAGSRNVPAIRIIERLGTERFYRLLKDAGFEHMDQPARDYGPSLALGTGGATLFEVTLLFGTLAAHGEMLPVQIAHNPEIRFGQNQRLFREDTALLIRHVLSDLEARRGSFGPRSFLDFPFDVAAKTGTSKDFRDSWAVGYTEQYVVGVWVGNFQSEPTLGVSGARGAGRIMHQVMRMLYENSDSRFEYPRHWKYANICKRTGKLAGPRCPHWTEPFLPHDVLPPPCDGNHSAIDSHGIVRPLPDQIYVLDPHRPGESQSILLEVRAEAQCQVSLNGERRAMPASGHMRTFMDPKPGRYELELLCPGRPVERRMFRIQK
ncbi:MAG: transglycosylase domain-containing protein [Leptospiraceae bacterium]|nr:transglycosylase domain-containing protein [Leptospiraceae bacterium]